MSDIKLNHWAFIYSISGEPDTFGEYENLGTSIIELFENQQDGNASIFRCYRPYALNQLKRDSIRQATVTPVKHLLTYSRPTPAEQITVTPIMHMRHMHRVLDNVEDQLDEAERKAEDIETEMEELESHLRDLEAKLGGVDDSDLATEMYQKNQWFGWSAKECLDYLFRNRQFAGEVK